MRRAPLSIALLVSTIAICRIARADGPAAEDKRPQAACASGDTAKGAAILGELYAESLNPAYVFNQGRCYQKNGQFEQARVRFDEYLRIGSHEPSEDIQRQGNRGRGNWGPSRNVGEWPTTACGSASWIA